MIENVDAYLAQLKRELAGSDPAIIQDALADAEEHLRNALDQIEGMGDQVSEADALVPIIEKYGTPEETAAAYREMAALTYPILREERKKVDMPLFNRFFGILGDTRAWGALLYFLFSWVTGIVYFVWGFTGLSLSLCLLILVIGLPFTVVFLLSVRSIALLEGRLVEALLGVRMPRRTFFTNRQVSWLEQIKDLFLEIRTWSTLTYMVLQLPLGIIYFVAFFTLISFSVAVIVNPFLVYVLDLHVVNIGWESYVANPELTFIFVFVGIIVLVGTLHLAKIVGRLHAFYAKYLLLGGFREIEEQTESNRNQAAHISEETMEIKEEEKIASDQRPPTFVIYLSIAFFLFTIGLVIMAFLSTNG
jgi:hypothetical protein